MCSHEKGPIPVTMTATLTWPCEGSDGAIPVKPSWSQSKEPEGARVGTPPGISSVQMTLGKHTDILFCIKVAMVIIAMLTCVQPGMLGRAISIPKQTCPGEPGPKVQP